jgi:hypothetical protein
MMEKKENLIWFKTNFEPLLKDYEVKIRFFENGDFGSLDQIEFNSPHKGGNLDLWGAGWIGVFLYDYRTDNEIMNVLLKPNEINEQKKLLKALKSLL